MAQDRAREWERVDGISPYDSGEKKPVVSPQITGTTVPCSGHELGIQLHWHLLEKFSTHGYLEACRKLCGVLKR